MALDTPTGQKAHNSNAELAYHRGSWRWWEQNGLSTSAGFVDASYNPTGHYTWRQTRSSDNTVKPTLYEDTEELTGCVAGASPEMPA